MSTANTVASRRLAGTFVAYGLGDFILFGLSYLVLIPVLTRYLSPAEYGIVATLNSVSGLLGYLFQFGFVSAAFRYYFLYVEGEERRAFFGSIVLFVLFLAGIMTISLLFFGRPIWESLIQNVSFDVYAPYVFWGTWFQVVSVFRSVLLRAQNRPRLYVVLDIAQFVCIVGLVLINVAVLKQGALGQVRAIFWVYGVFAIVSSFVLIPNIRLRFKWAYVRDCIGFAFPVLLSYLVGFFQNRGNVLIFQYLVAGGAVGVFAFGQQIGNIIQMVSGSFEKGWQPFLYEQSAESARHVLGRLMVLSVPLIMGFVLGMGLFAPEIVQVASSTAYADAWIVITIGGFGAGLIAISSLLNGGLYYAKRSNYSTFTTIVGALVNVSVNFALIPPMGIVGAALASVLSGLIVLILVVLGVRRYFSEQLEYGKILSSLGLSILILVGTVTILNGVSRIPYSIVFLVKTGAVTLYALLVGYFLWGVNETTMREFAKRVRQVSYSFRR